jgi:NAD(P)-dependent dehydrogenase (short-subunit alcohol dehydrogenase family)
MQEFHNKVVLVTGAGRNLGRAIALHFAAQGARLALNDINPDHLEETAEQVRALGAQANTYVFDVAKRMPVEAMLSQLLEDFGRLDILINNAAVHPHARIVDMDEWDWHRTLDVNLGGPFFAMQHAARAMMTTGGGVVVNLAAAEIRSSDLKHSAAYLASKAGLLALTRAAAVEFASLNIRVNAVCPGDIRPPSAQGEVLHGVPLARPGKYDEVASLVVHLCTSQSSYITGTAVNIDGGASILLP